MDKSISSEKRSIIFHALLNDVPPLKCKCWEYLFLNVAFKTIVTQRSFSPRPFHLFHLKHSLVVI